MLFPGLLLLSEYFAGLQSLSDLELLMEAK